MPDLQTNPDSLHSAADQLRAESRRIETALAGLDQEATRLRALWDGAARDAYDAAHRDWSTTLGEMKTLLARMAAATDGIADRYVDADVRSATLYSRPE